MDMITNGNGALLRARRRVVFSAVYVSVCLCLRGFSGGLSLEISPDGLEACSGRPMTSGIQHSLREQARIGHECRRSQKVAVLSLN